MRTAGYSGTPLARKLGYKPGTRAALIGAPRSHRSLLEPLPEGVIFGRAPGPRTDLVHLFVTSRSELAKHLKALLPSLRSDAALWISWPKKASGVKSDLGENDLRAAALPLGLVDIKVCAVDETWSALKFVVRKKLRHSTARKAPPAMRR